MKAICILSILLASTSSLVAQQSADDKLFETLHGHGSFNVVFAVLIIILGGVLIAIWRLDRKVSKLEKEIKK